MDFIDGLKVTGRLRLTLFDQTGAVKSEFYAKNLVVDAGKDYIAERMKDAVTTAMSHMAIGESSTAAAAGDTALGNEAGRVALDSTVVTSNEVQYDATFGPGVGTGAIVEAGIFNAGAGGDMLVRTTFAVINKGANDTLGITWTVTIN